MILFISQKPIINVSFFAWVAALFLLCPFRLRLRLHLPSFALTFVFRPSVAFAFLRLVRHTLNLQ